MKRCTKCGTEYPATRDNFYANKTARDGLESRCKTCCIKKARDWALKNPEKHLAHKREEYARNPEKFHARLKAYYEKNPDYKREYKQKYWVENGEELRQKQKERRENDPKAKEVSRAWEAANKERRREGHRAWKAANREELRDRYRIHSIKRRARKESLPDTLTSEQWNYALKYFDGRCAVCGRRADRSIGLTIAADHWIALKQPDCPGTVFENMVPLCHGLTGRNNGKKDRLPEEWLTSRYGVPKAGAIMQWIDSYFYSLPTF